VYANVIIGIGHVLKSNSMSSQAMLTGNKQAKEEIIIGNGNTT